MKIQRITATPVEVPTKPNSIQSAAIDRDDWSKSPDMKHMPKHGTGGIGALAKYILHGYTDTGLVGIGETYREVDTEHLARHAAALLGVDLRTLSLRHLPMPVDREYHAFELLAYDLMGKSLGVSVCTLLGGPVRDAVEVSSWSGRRTPEEAGDRAVAALAAGFDCIKFKCNQDDDVVAWARIIAERCEGRMRVILDPNQRWGDYQTAHDLMTRLAPYTVLIVEDPIDRRELADYKRLRGIGGIQVVRHVALPYCDHGQRASDAIDALRHDAVDGFNFNGPMAHFQRLAELADVAGLSCWHGSEVDLGILEAGYVHAAASAPACRWPSDIFGRLVREHDLLETPLSFRGKVVDIPTGPGLGVTIDATAMETYRCGPDLDFRL